MLMSVGVIIAAILIYIWPALWFADPFCTYIFSLIVIYTTLPLAKSCLQVMMEGAPDRIDTLQLESDIWSLNKEKSLIRGVHDLHVWSINTNNIAMTVHIISQEP